MKSQKPQTLRITRDEMNLALAIRERRNEDATTTTAVLHEALRIGLLVSFALHRGASSDTAEYTEEDIARVLRPYGAMLLDFLSEHGKAPTVGVLPSQSPQPCSTPALPAPAEPALEQGEAPQEGGDPQIDETALRDMADFGNIE